MSLRKNMQDYCDSKEWEELDKDELLKVIQDTINVKIEKFIGEVDTMLTKAFKLKKDMKKFQPKFDAAFDKIVALAKDKGLDKRAKKGEKK